MVPSRTILPTALGRNPRLGIALGAGSTIGCDTIPNWEKHMLRRLNSPLSLAALLLISLTAGALRAQAAVQILGTGTQPPAGNISAGQNNAVIMGFGLTKLIAGAIGFTGVTINVNAAHTALAADFTSVKLARDLNTNGVIDAGEIIATTTSFPATFGSFTTAQPIPQQPMGNLYLVGVDVAVGATVGRIFSLQLQGNADVTLNPLATTRAGAPIVGNNQTVIAASTAEIDVQRPLGTSIVTGATDNIGNVATGAPTNFTWTILNTTSTVATLNLTGTPRVNIPVISVNNCTATVTTQPAATVAPAGSTTFVVSIQPTAAGPFGFGMFIPNNDANENPYNVIVNGTGSTPSPEMDVTRGPAVADGGTDTVTGASAGVASVLTYTITNSGSANLTFSLPVAAPGALTNCTASITTPPATPVAPAGTTTLVVTVTPLAAGVFSCTLSVGNNDASENPYDWTISGTATGAAAPEMDVTRGGAVADAGTDTVTGATAGTAAVLTYTIINSGTASLTMTTPVGAPGTLSNCTASITTDPASPVAAAGTTTFAVSVTPTAAGLFSCTVSISNNDSTENPYNWTISGTASAPAPEMDVTRGATPVANAGADALGSSAFGVAQTLTYTITNSGTATLNLTGAPGLVVATAGTNCTAGVSTQPASATVAPAASVTFVVTFTVMAAGVFNFTVSAANNDSNENPYAWTVSGTGAASVPEMDLTRAATAVADGSTDAIGNYVQLSATTVTYTITNSGTAALNITTPVTVAGATNCTVTVTSQPGNTVATAGTTTLILSVTPSSAAAFSFTVSIVSDDPNESPYDWTVSGTGTIGGGGNGSSGSDEGGCSTNENPSWILLAGALALLVVSLRLRKLSA